MALKQSDIQAGKWVRWESQSGGNWKVKQGEIVAVLPAGQHLPPFYKVAVQTCATDVKVLNLKTDPKAIGISQFDRVVVAVVVNEKTGLRRLYTPTASVLVDNGTLMGKREVTNLLTPPKTKKKKG